MLEIILNPKKAERRPWELFFVGFFYAAISLLMVNWLFAGNPVFSKHMSILVVTFTVMLSIPFMYYTIKIEEERGIFEDNKFTLLKGHSRAISAFLWLFLGFLIAFSLFYIIFPEFVGNNFQAQIEQYCIINMPFRFNECVSNAITANALSVGGSKIIDILTNNFYVLLFCLIFSLVFGAGAIFILAWNATVIATAIGIFAKSSMTNMPAAIFRYMIHGLPEIAAYFIAALAGGIISICLIRYDIKDQRFWRTMADSLNLILISIIILIIAAFIEVFITPKIF
ncbi:MAG: stage II sporulation protein M [Candidatus Pacearchaeota archaeon]